MNCELEFTQSGHRIVQILCTEAMHVHGSVCIHEGGVDINGAFNITEVMYVIMMIFGKYRRGITMERKWKSI